MSNFWELLQGAYSLIHEEKYDEAEIKFKELYESVDPNELLAESNEHINYINCLLGLWELYMKKWELEKSLEYYLQWDKLTSWKDFNILFNLGVVYTNLGNKEKAEVVLQKAKEMEPNNPNLLRFLQQSGSYYNDGEWNETVEFNSTFEEKVKKMIEEINK